MHQSYPQPLATRPLAATLGYLLALFLVTSASFAQAPNTDIILLERSQQTGEFKGLHRVTNREQYDNQPKFLPNGQLVYTAAGEQTTEIRSYSPEAKTHQTLFSLPENLYSPTPVPGEAAVSVIRDYGNQVQQLWKLPLDGSTPVPLQTAINPIGYHAWINRDQLILFVLGEPQTLQSMTIGEEEGQFLHESPGRALAKLPAALASSGGIAEMSFTRPIGTSASADSYELVAVTMEPSPAFRRVVRLPGANQDYAWAPDGTLWLGLGTELQVWNNESWTTVLDVAESNLASAPLGAISRLAWSDDGRYLALVINR